MSSKIWGFFITFGSFFSGIMGIVIVFKILKWVIDTIIHAKTLHELYGFSLVILGAIWDSVTLFLIHRKGTKSSPFEGPINKQDIKNCQEGQEMEILDNSPDSSHNVVSAPLLKEKTNETMRIYPDLQQIKAPTSCNTYFSAV